MSRYAAIDVGSNSVRLLIADIDASGRAVPLHVDREVARLGTGAFRSGRLDPDAMDLACRVLERMTLAIERHEVDRLRAVGTSALRDASNRAEFVLSASSILGCPLDVVGGLEEARLVQLGVASCWPQGDERVLIVDVGGGSVQLILSDRERFAAGTSLPLGAVRLTEMFLLKDPPGASEIARMRFHIREQVATVAGQLARQRIDRVIATSATAGAIVCAVHEIKRSQRQNADRLSASAGQVSDLLETLTTLDVEGRADIVGVGRRRAEIVVAGVAVLGGILEGLRLPGLHYSIAGVRDGIIADLQAQSALGHRPKAPLQTRNTNVT